MQKTWNPSSEICHKQIQAERRARTSHPCALCHAMLLTAVPRAGGKRLPHPASLLCTPWRCLASAQYISKGDLATLCQQWQEKTRCLSEGESQRNVPKWMSGLPWEGSFKTIDLCCASRPQRVAITKHRALAERISAGITGWHRRSVTPRLSQLTHVHCSLTKTSHLRWTLTSKQQKSKKAAGTSVFYLVCSSFMWLTI